MNYLIRQEDDKLIIIPRALVKETQDGKRPAKGSKISFASINGSLLVGTIVDFSSNLEKLKELLSELQAEKLKKLKSSQCQSKNTLATKPSKLTKYAKKELSDLKAEKSKRASQSQNNKTLGTIKSSKPARVENPCTKENNFIQNTKQLLMDNEILKRLGVPVKPQNATLIVKKNQEVDFKENELSWMNEQISSMKKDVCNMKDTLTTALNSLETLSTNLELIESVVAPVAKIDLAKQKGAKREVRKQILQLYERPVGRTAFDESVDKTGMELYEKQDDDDVDIFAPDDLPEKNEKTEEAYYYDSDKDIFSPEQSDLLNLQVEKNERTPNDSTPKSNKKEEEIFEEYNNEETSSSPESPSLLESSSRKRRFFPKKDESLDGELSCGEESIEGSAKKKDEKIKKVKIDYPDNMDIEGKWTLKYKNLNEEKDLRELITRSRIYVKNQDLIAAKKNSDNQRKLARNLLKIVFTEKALTMCNLRGKYCNSSDLAKGRKPGLYQEGVDIIMTYARRYATLKSKSETNPWTVVDDTLVTRSLTQKMTEMNIP